MSSQLMLVRGWRMGFWGGPQASYPLGAKSLPSRHPACYSFGAQRAAAVGPNPTAGFGYLYSLILFGYKRAALAIRPGDLNTWIVQARRGAKDRGGEVEIDLTRALGNRVTMARDPVLDGLGCFERARID